jgi:hypothetical protein
MIAKYGTLSGGGLGLVGDRRGEMMTNLPKHLMRGMEGGISEGEGERQLERDSER